MKRYEKTSKERAGKTKLAPLKAEIFAGEPFKP